MSDAAASTPVTAPQPGLPRVLFVDLDGTLLATGSHLRRRNADALAAVAALGTTVVLATGGFAARTRVVADALRGAGVSPLWTVTHNGAAIWDPSGHLVHRQPIPREALASAVRNSGRSVWTVFEVVTPDGQTRTGHAGRVRHELEPFIWGPKRRADDNADVPLASVEPDWDPRDARRLAQVINGGGADVLAVWVIGTARALAPLDAIADDGLLCGALYEPWTSRVGSMTGNKRLRIEGRDVNPAGTTKATAVAWLCRHLGVPLTATAAFGDGRNDRDMIATVARGVAMANAHASVLAAATRLAPHHDDDGVACVVEEWLSSGEW